MMFPKSSDLLPQTFRSMSRVHVGLRPGSLRWIMPGTGTGKQSMSTSTSPTPAPVVSKLPQGRRQALLDWIRGHPEDVSVAVLLLAAVYATVSHLLRPTDMGDEMMRLAEHLSRQGSYTNPFAVLETGPTAANPPLYPFVLALFVRAFHSSALVYNAAIAGCTIANTLTALLLLRLSVVFYGDILPGVMAALLWIPVMPDMPGWDTSYTVAGLLLFCLVTSSLTRENWGLTKSALGGLLAGLLFLLNPSSLLVSLPWLGFLLYRARPVSSSTIKGCAIVFVVLSGFVLGWCERNYRQLGAFVVRTNLGMTLYASNNDCAQSSLIRDELNGCYQTHHPNVSLREATLLRSLGEAGYDRLRRAESFRWMRAHPARLLRLTTARFWQFWFPATENFPATISRAGQAFDVPGWMQSWIANQNRLVCGIWVVTVLSIPGLVLMWQRREPLIGFMLLALAIYPLLYYLVVSDVRYRYPVLWLSLLSAGYFLAEVANGGTGTNSSSIRSAPSLGRSEYLEHASRCKK